MSSFLTSATYVIAGLCALVWLSQIGLLVRLIPQRFRHDSAEPSSKISVLVALDETVSDPVANVHQALRAGGNEVEVIAVVDGSVADTLDRLSAEFELEDVHPIYRKILQTQDIRTVHRSSQDRRLVVVQKLAGGRGDALNAALNVSAGDRVIVLDPGVELTESGLVDLDAAFGLDVAVVLGRLTDPSQGWVRGSRLARKWVLDQLVWRHAGGSLGLPNAAALYDRRGLIAAGGFVTQDDPDGSQILVRLGLSGTRTKTAGKAWAIESAVGTSSSLAVTGGASPSFAFFADVGWVDVGSKSRRLGVVHQWIVRMSVPLLMAAVTASLLGWASGASADPLRVVLAAGCVRAATLILAASVADRSATEPRHVLGRTGDVFSVLLDVGQPNPSSAIRSGHA